MKIFATPRKASTVAVIKNPETSSGIKVLLMKRHPSDRFLPGYYVFPGGAVEEHDSPDLFKLVYTPSENSGITDMGSAEYLKHKICAVRETFEESGILFAEKNNIAQDEQAIAMNRFSSYREKIIKGEMKLQQMMEIENITPAIDRLHYLSRWITPPLSPIRYDTRFFVARLPENQNISHDGEELVSSEWLSPEVALEMEKRREIKMVAPTIRTLEFLSRFKSVDDAENHFLSGVNSPAISF